MINESGTGLYKVNPPTTLLWNTMVNYRQLSKKFWNNGFKVTPIFFNDVSETPILYDKKPDER